MLRPAFLIAISFAAIATPAFAQAPAAPMPTIADTLKMTCAEVQQFVRSNPNGSMLNTSTRRRGTYVQNAGLCAMTSSPLVRQSVPTSDRKACTVGITCSAANAQKSGTQTEK